jgi:hypothetical protein
MDVKKTQRRYPDIGWDYKAVSARIDDHGKERDVYFYKLKDKGTKKVGVEVYAGKNYIVGSNEHSHSQSYPMTRVPKKYKTLVNELKSKHSKMKWSRAKKVNSN